MAYNINRTANTGVKMDAAALERFKKYTTTLCKYCHCPVSFTNPMARCKKCGFKFCFKHTFIFIGKKGVENYCPNHKK